VRGGNPTFFELQLMDCFTYVDGVLMLKLPSGKLIKSYLNPPKPPAPVADPVGLGHKDNPIPATPPDPVIPPDTKPLAPIVLPPS
jgi:hypothetical protein